MVVKNGGQAVSLCGALSDTEWIHTCAAQRVARSGAGGTAAVFWYLTLAAIWQRLEDRRSGGAGGNLNDDKEETWISQIAQSREGTASCPAASAAGRREGSSEAAGGP